MSLAVNQLTGFGGYRTVASGGGITSAYAGTATGAGGTYSGVPIGTAASNRRVVVGMAGNGSDVTALTVAGQSCTRVATGGSGTRWCDLFVTDAYVTSGTTATIVVTGGGAEVRLFVWTITGTSTAATYQTQTDSTAPLSVSLDIPAGGVAFMVANCNASCSGFTGTGFTQDSLNETSGFGSVAIHGDFASAQTALTVAAAGGTGTCGLIAASWSP